MLQPHQMPRRGALHRAAKKINHCLLLQGLLASCAALHRGVPRREIKAGESLSFTAPHFFGVALWPIIIVRRVMHNQHPKKQDFHALRYS